MKAENLLPKSEGNMDYSGGIAKTMREAKICLLGVSIVDIDNGVYFTSVYF